MFRWTLVTTTFNSSLALEKFWSDIRIPDDIEWIVVDNASVDESRVVAKHFGARVIALPKNRGFGAANNIGFWASDSQYVAFVNPDVTVKLSDLELLETVLQHDTRALVAPQLRNSDGSLQPNGRGKPHLAFKVLHRLWPKLVDSKYRRYAGAGELIDVDWLIGAVIAGTRDHLAELGPWDDKFFVYYEDADLCLRNSALGGRNLLVGDANWTHGWARETQGAFKISAWKHELGSMFKFYKRYPNLLH